MERLFIKPLQSTTFTMERLFSPCTRLHDLTANQDDFDEDMRYNLQCTEELNLNVPTEEFLSAEYTDLYAMLGNEDTVAWLTPYASVVRGDGRAVSAWTQLDGYYHFSFSADRKNVFAFARSPVHLLEIVDVVLRLLAVSVVQSVDFTDFSSSIDVFINAPTLANLMEQCQSLKFLSLKNIQMDEDHCRVLGGYSRPCLEIVLDRCKITSAGASALAESLGRNQGPTKLDYCGIDNSVIADGLRGNSRLKVFRAYIANSPDYFNRQLLPIAGALRENKGLVELEFFLVCV
jgi:hypothetical protein